MFAAPAVMVAPFLLGFGTAATVLTVAIGALLMGLALQVEGPSRSVPASAHAGFDYTLAATAAIAGLAVGADHGRVGRHKLFGRYRPRNGRVDRVHAVQRGPRSLTSPTFLPQTKNTHISLLPVPETPRKVRGVSLWACHAVSRARY